MGSPAGPSPLPVPSRVRCSPHRQGPGIPESVHRPSPEASSPPRDSQGNTRAPPWGDTHFPPPPPSAPRAPSSPKEYGRFRVCPKVGAWPRPSSMWAPPRGFGSRPLRTWSRPVVIWSLPASGKLGPSSSSLRADLHWQGLRRTIPSSCAPSRTPSWESKCSLVHTL